LRDKQKIDYLVLSRRNLGKIDAFKLLFNMAPGEIVAYSDDDILFYPGWLEAHLEILETYPNVGMVSGAPVRNASGRARKSLRRWIDTGPPDLQVSYERRIPDDWEADWAVSTGRDPEEHLRASQEEQDLVLKFKGLESYGSASHFQFVSYKDVIQSALPDEWSGKLMGQMMELDEAIDGLGFLRLCTVDRYARHLGNALSPEVIGEVRSFGIDSSVESVKASPTKRHWILRIPGSGRILRFLYNRLFEILNR
jgi:glycosyltransferase involved in cell wall biosynthesis